jgi:methionyl-tRNA formyltransferase
MAGESETGVTIMRVVKALDAGAMLARIVVPIGPDDTSADLERVMGAAGATLLVQVVSRLALGPVIEDAQDDRAATYAAKITRADSAVDWRRSAPAIHNQIRGLHPWPHASSVLAGQRVILHRSSRPDVHVAGALTMAPGHVHASSPAGIDVVAGDGALVRLLTLQAEGGRAVSAAEFLAGRPLPAGAAFEGV